MSHTVYLQDAVGNTVTVPTHTEGGTYVIGGTNAAELNITYNYTPYYLPFFFDGLNSLHGQRASVVIADLERAVASLGTQRADDYWQRTPGNAGYALSILLAWARLYPDATFVVN